MGIRAVTYGALFWEIGGIFRIFLMDIAMETGVFIRCVFFTLRFFEKIEKIKRDFQKEFLQKASFLRKFSKSVKKDFLYIVLFLLLDTAYSVFCEDWKEIEKRWTCILFWLNDSREKITSYRRFSDF